MAVPFSRQPGRMIRVTFWALLLATSPAMAGKVYKVIDENGKITFTDKPPMPAESVALTTEQVDVQEDSGNRTALTQLGNSQFCGHLKMPVDNGYGGQFLERVIYTRQQWERQLDSLERTISQSSSNSYYSRYNKPRYNQNASPENLEKMRDYRCGIYWANQTELAMKQEKADLISKVASHNRHLEELIHRKASTCGHEPEFGTPDFTERKREWYKCSAEYDTLIREGQRALNEADQKLTAIQKVGR